MPESRDAAEAANPFPGRGAALCIILLSCALYAACWAYFPLRLQPWARHDDGLFMFLGQCLAEGRWLCDYSRFTLMKGPGYPVFLAVNAWLGLPIAAAQALFHSLSIAFFCCLVKKLSGSWFLALVVFLLALWHPALFFVDRVVRDAIYPGQTLLVLGCAGYCLLAGENRGRRLAWGLMGGFLAGWFWLTREEGVWIAPAMLFLLMVAIARNRSWKGLYQRVLIPVAVALAAFVSVQAAFQIANRIAYGKFVGVEFKERNFRRAMRALQSVGAANPVPYVPVPKSARERLYAVSPAFAGLQVYLDPKNRTAPWQDGCRYYPSTCGDIAGGWFMWALREAVETTGRYRTPAVSSALYGRMADEIESACRSGRLDCRDQALPLIPAVSAEQLKSIPERIYRAADKLVLAGFQSPAARRNADALQSPPANVLRLLNDPQYLEPARQQRGALPPDQSGPRSRNASEQPVRAWTLNKLVSDLVSGLFSFYQALLPFGMWGGATVFLFANLIAFKKRRYPPLLAVAGAALILIVTRLAILIVIDISAFPGLSWPYMAPLFPLSCIAAILSAGALIPLLRQERKSSGSADR